MFCLKTKPEKAPKHLDSSINVLPKNKTREGPFLPGLIQNKKNKRDLLI